MEEFIIGSRGNSPAGNLTQGSKAASFIKDSSTQNFMQDVIEASMTQPVIVDFWASWCGPCKQLTPMLERAVQAARGTVILVKIDIDKNQELAGQLRIQSVPTIYAFFQGRPVDGFAGLVPESQVKLFIERLTKLSGGNEPQPSPLEEAEAAAGAALEANDFATASMLFQQILSAAPDSLPALIGLARCYIAAHDVERAEALLARLPGDKAQDGQVVALRTQIELARQAAQARGQLTEFEQKLLTDPNAHQARFDLATALFAGGEREAAIDHLLELFRRDRNWNDQAARTQLVKFFDAMGGSDPLTQAGRRKLSSLLFS